MKSKDPRVANVVRMDDHRNEENPMVRVLEDLLVEARSGNLHTFVGVTVLNSHPSVPEEKGPAVGTYLPGEPMDDYYVVLGALAELQTDLIKKNRQMSGEEQ